MEKFEVHGRNLFSPKTIQFFKTVYQRLPNQMKGVVRKLRQKINTTNTTNTPSVSCICPTHGRVEFLEEAIYSFLQQDFTGSKELIVLNDNAQQTLVYNHPEVRIINLPRRFRTLGEKYKAAVGFCTHDLIFVWSNSAIYLPHRITYSVQHHLAKQNDLNPKKNKTFYGTNRAWLYDGQQIGHALLRKPHYSSSWSRELFTSVRGYAHISRDFDKEIETQFAKIIRPLETDDIAPQDIYHIQRQGEHDSYELSDMDKEMPKQGLIELTPQWRADYLNLVKAYLHLEKGKRK